ncbi:MAG TPA: hypothetical protein VF492_01740, partial [Verrucomicrobiae bacterium]
MKSVTARYSAPPSAGGGRLFWQRPVEHALGNPVGHVVILNDDLLASVREIAMNGFEKRVNIGLDYF